VQPTSVQRICLYKDLSKKKCIQEEVIKDMPDRYAEEETTEATEDNSGEDMHPR